MTITAQTIITAAAVIAAIIAIFKYYNKMRFLTRYDGEVSEPLVGRQGSRVSMRVARASASLLSSHGRVPGTSPG